jgi:excisionase family DNA binding protein
VTRGGVVYFVEAEGPGLIKIGATRDLTQRLATLTSENAVPVRLVGALAHRDAPAYADQLRRRFAAMCDHGDWFRPWAPLRAFLGGLAAAVPATPSSPRPMAADEAFPFDAPPALLDAPALAAHLRVSTVTVRRWVRARQLPCIRVGRQLRFDVRDPVIAARRRWIELTRSA